MLNWKLRQNAFILSCHVGHTGKFCRFLFSPVQVLRLSIDLYKGPERRQFAVHNSPVVPAGTMVLKYSTTSNLFSDLAVFAKQRIHCLVSGFGLANATGFNCKLSPNWTTTSLGLHDWAWMDFRTSAGRASDFPFVQNNNKNIWEGNTRNGGRLSDVLFY